MSNFHHLWRLNLKPTRIWHLNVKFVKFKYFLHTKLNKSYKGWHLFWQIEILKLSNKALASIWQLTNKRHHSALCCVEHIQFKINVGVNFDSFEIVNLSKRALTVTGQLLNSKGAKMSFNVNLVDSWINLIGIVLLFIKTVKQNMCQNWRKL